MTNQATTLKIKATKAFKKDLKNALKIPRQNTELLKHPLSPIPNPKCQNVGIQCHFF